ncbi:unnamed protein product [Trichogramma brassicae]|uniref:Uncharacterized protein n=1 Tax=Trichogramma brassicae TaxID=86971 RepID=A0A6H5IE61_9HYME|nr:unnamed protein product [Trichogramma brassicae]
MFEMMNRLMNKVEGLCTSVRELDLRVSEQEAKSSAPVSPIKEDLENVKISTAKCSEFISRIPSIIAPYSATDQCEMLLSGVPSGLELSDNQVLKKTFSAMGMEHHERFITRTRSWKPKNSRSVKEHTRAIVLQCSSPIAQEHRSAESATALAKMQNEIEEVKENASKAMPECARCTKNIARDYHQCNACHFCVHPGCAGPYLRKEGTKPCCIRTFSAIVEQVSSDALVESSKASIITKAASATSRKAALDKARGIERCERVAADTVGFIVPVVMSNQPVAPDQAPPPWLYSGVRWFNQGGTGQGVQRDEDSLRQQTRGDQVPAQWPRRSTMS